MFEISVLASGSSGNCFYIGTDKAEFLIDAGISCKQIFQRLEKIGKSIQNIQGIFITHEHLDHIRGIGTVSKRFNIPVFINRGTLEQCAMDRGTINLIRTDREINFHGLQILPFSKSHDAHDPVSYLIGNHDTKISVMTDIGFCCENVKYGIKESVLIILESNHDTEMLENGPYPFYLKQRIAGNKGHLSNYAAAVAVRDYGSKNLQYALLSHLSLNNNTPDQALQTFTSIVQERRDLRNFQIRLSSREEPTALIRLEEYCHLRLPIADFF